MENHIKEMRKWLDQRDIQCDDNIVYAIHRFSVLYAQKFIRECINDKVLSCKLKGEKMTKVNLDDIAKTFERMKGIQGGHISRMTEQRKKKLIKMINSQDLQIDKKNETFLYMSNEIPHMLTKQQFQLGFDDSGKEIKMSKKKAIVIELPQEEDEQKKIQQNKNRQSNSLNKSKNQNQERKLDESKQKKSKNLQQEEIKNDQSSTSKESQFIEKSEEFNKSKSSNTSSQSQNNSQPKKRNLDLKYVKEGNEELTKKKQEKKEESKDFQIEERDDQQDVQILKSRSNLLFSSSRQQKNANQITTQSGFRQDNQEIIVINSSQTSQSTESIVYEDHKQIQVQQSEQEKTSQIQQELINKYLNQSQAYRNLSQKHPIVFQILKKKFLQRKRQLIQRASEFRHQNQFKKGSKEYNQKEVLYRQVLAEQFNDPLNKSQPKSQLQIRELQKQIQSPLICFQTSKTSQQEVIQVYEIISSSSTIDLDNGSNAIIQSAVHQKDINLPNSSTISQASDQTSQLKKLLSRQYIQETFKKQNEKEVNLDINDCLEVDINQKWNINDELQTQEIE